MDELKNNDMNGFEFIEAEVAEVIDETQEFERSDEFDETPVEIY